MVAFRLVFMLVSARSPMLSPAKRRVTNLPSTKTCKPVDKNISALSYHEQSKGGEMHERNARGTAAHKSSHLQAAHHDHIELLTQVALLAPCEMSGQCPIHTQKNTETIANI